MTVTDSAGVAITLSSDFGATYATLGPEPLLSLGGPNAEGATQFYQIDRVAQLEDELWVADGQSGELRVFSTGGSHLRTLGGRGDGPGEYLRIRLLGDFADDSVAVADQRTGRVTVYGPDGAFVRSDRVLAADRALPRPFDVFSDGSVLAQVPEIRAAGSLEIGAVMTDGVRLFRFGGTTEPETVAVDADAGPLWLWTGRDAMTPLPFTANAAFDLRSDSLHFAAGPAFRIRVFAEGAVVRIYGLDREPQGATASDAERYRDVVVEAYPEARQPALLEAMDHPAAPSLLPAYTGLVVAADGTVWAGRYAPDTLWDVFGAEGELLGRVEMPTGFYPMSIRDGRVAGVWRDELGVEYVQVYATRR